MAIVRLGEQNKVLIMQVVNNSFGARTNEILATKPKSPELAQSIYDRMFGKFKPLLDQLGHQWLKYSTEFHVRSIAGLDIHERMRLEKAQPFPVIDTTDLDTAAWAYRSDRVILHNHPMWDHEITIFRAWYERMSKHTERQREFVGGVRSLLDRHATLGPALKEWPALWDFIPQNIKDHHIKIVPRSKKEHSEVEHSNLDQLTAVATAIKLTR